MTAGRLQHRDFDERLQEVLALHFDPCDGTPYWLDQVPRLGFDPRERIRRIDDLPLFGMMDQEAMRRRPLLDFTPRSVASVPSRIVTAQTGGTLGSPIWTAYLEDEFRQAFVDPFVAAAQHLGFPIGGTWLYVGPSGPHIIGRAADAIARATGSPAPFTVDFDPRWATKLEAGSFAARRYLDHVVEPAMAVIHVQPVSTLFTTPVVVAKLAEAMTEAQRRSIRGVHYGGMSLDPALLVHAQAELFPEAVHLSGYGNTLFGCCLELTTCPGREPTYFPHGTRLVFGVVSDSSPQARTAEYGRLGLRRRLVFSRLDRTLLLINVLERDEGCLCAPSPAAPPGFVGCGICSPSPARAVELPESAAIY